MQISPRFGAAFAIPMEIAVFIVLGLVGGMWVDRHFHSSPWGLLVGIVLGLAGAMRAVLKIVRLSSGDETQASDDSDLKPPPAEPTDPSRAPPARPRPSSHD